MKVLLSLAIIIWCEALLLIVMDPGNTKPYIIALFEIIGTGHMILAYYVLKVSENRMFSRK